MIIVKTPYRISFFGGGTDLPEWYNKNNGSVISTTIQNYSYIVLRELPDIFNYNYRIRFYRRDEVNKLNQIKHPVVREVLKRRKINIKLDITHHGDLPARTGIGSSSCFTVGLIHALNTIQNKKTSKKSLALDAINIEQNILKESVGSQDQVACSFGGLNRINFNKKKDFICKKIRIKSEKIADLESSILLIYTNQVRNSSILERKKIDNIRNKEAYYKRIYELVNEGENILTKSNKGWLKEFSEILNEQWFLKKELVKNVSNNKLDELYDLCIKNGALAGKLLGSGGGGFLMLIVPKKSQKKIITKIGKLKYLQCKFDNDGSKLIYRSYEK